MLFGMGTVFLFLVLLVGATWTLSAAIAALGYAATEQAEPGGSEAPAVDRRRAAAITAAVHLHRQRRQNSE